MARHFPFYLLVLAALAAACAAPGGEPGREWHKLAGAARATLDFDFDNQRCGASASRMKPPPRADQAAGRGSCRPPTASTGRRARGPARSRSRPTWTA